MEQRGKVQDTRYKGKKAFCILYLVTLYLPRHPLGTNCFALTKVIH